MEIINENSKQGWVLIYRKMMSSDGYFSEPFCRNMAWIDLILLANYKDGFFRAKGHRIQVKRGQVGYSLENLAARWKWSRGKAERFMKELEMDNQIVRQKSNITTLISIVNYDEYQQGGNADGNADDNADSKADSKADGKADGHKQRKVNKPKKVKKIQEPVSPLLINFCHEGENFKNTYLSWLQHLEFKNKMATEPTIIQQMQFLKNYDEETATKILLYSLTGGYTSLYEPKPNNGNYVGEKSNSTGSATTRAVASLLSSNEG